MGASSPIVAVPEVRVGIELHHGDAGEIFSARGREHERRGDAVLSPHTDDQRLVQVRDLRGLQDPIEIGARELALTRDDVVCPVEAEPGELQASFFIQRFDLPGCFEYGRGPTGRSSAI